MKFLDLFSGIGGFRIGMEMAGHECVGHCEIDKFANRSYKAMHQLTDQQQQELLSIENRKEAVKYIESLEQRGDEWFGTDIKRVRADEFPYSDCWCFGFPCQDISIAGTQDGFADGKRSSLFFTVTGLIRNLEEKDKPSILLIENVKNLLSINRGFDFLKLQVELDEVGYDTEWDVINSKDVGVPQNRERVFIVGHLRKRSRQKVFPINSNGKKNNIIQAQYINTITTRTGSSTAVGSYIVKSKQHEQKLSIQNPNKLIQTAQLYGTTKERNPQAGRVYDTKGIAPTLDACGGGNRMPKISTTITSNSWQENNLLHTNIDIRKITPKECFRLQGFSDCYFELARRVNSDSQLYKQAGNSVTVTVIYEIAKRL